MNGQLLRAAAEEIQGPTKFEISTYPIHNRVRFCRHWFLSIWSGPSAFYWEEKAPILTIMPWEGFTHNPWHFARLKEGRIKPQKDHRYKVLFSGVSLAWGSRILGHCPQTLASMIISTANSCSQLKTHDHQLVLG